MASVNFQLAPERAVEFFRAKGLNPSFAWQDMLHAEHDRAFTVAKMTDVDLLGDVRVYVDRAVAEGWTRERFIEELRPELMRRGWWGEAMMRDPATGEMREVQLGSVRRLKIIYDTNLRTAYAAGRWARIRENAEQAPYVMYSAILDERTRPHHRNWNGRVLRWDDPWWQTHTPPNGWNCRCTVIQLDARGLARLGKDGPDRAPPSATLPWTNPRTGEILQVPVGVDPGFGYAPGATFESRVAETDRLAREKAAAAAPELRAAFLEWLDATVARRRAVLSTGIAAAAYDPKQARHPKGTPREGGRWMVGAEGRAVIAAVEAARLSRRDIETTRTWGAVTKENAKAVERATGVRLSGYTRGALDGYIRHSLGRHADASKEVSRAQRALTVEDFGRIPRIVSAPDRVVLGDRHRRMPVLRYVKKIGSEEYHYHETVHRRHSRVMFISLWIKPLK